MLKSLSLKIFYYLLQNLRQLENCINNLFVYKMDLLVVNSSTWMITILGWGIVFVALFILVGIFLLVPKIINKATVRKVSVKGEPSSTSVKMHEVTGETNAVIATALYLYFNENHDEESNIITIKKVRRRYSPWSSKLYGMNNMGFRIR